MAASCSGPSGSPSSQAPDTIATIGTAITVSQATLAGCSVTIENNQTVPMKSGTSVM